MAEGRGGVGRLSFLPPPLLLYSQIHSVLCNSHVPLDGASTARMAIMALLLKFRKSQQKRRHLQKFETSALPLRF